MACMQNTAIELGIIQNKWVKTDTSVSPLAPMQAGTDAKTEGLNHH